MENIKLFSGSLSGQPVRSQLEAFHDSLNVIFQPNTTMSVENETYDIVSSSVRQSVPAVAGGGVIVIEDGVVVVVVVVVEAGVEVVVVVVVDDGEEVEGLIQFLRELYLM